MPHDFKIITIDNDSEDILEELKKADSQGWEIVSMIPNSVSLFNFDRLKLVFKRKKTS